ncbi:hypothetical protein PANDA_016415 [Ailuropoda melanoleuca]|uniref:GRAM domain-containing protein n=1 Tax=Ailuropoda melanoleuca TaxID=9646 RepID=D2HVL0_AILME|nr:hypothetical protein PANDA_016415 [Ailuropoda melanoleuca]
MPAAEQPFLGYDAGTKRTGGAPPPPLERACPRGRLGARRWQRLERVASLSVLTQCQDVELSFLQQPEGSSYFSGTKKGTLFLTSYRVIFVTSHTVNDPMFSFMMPFDLMSNCTIEQPVFTPNFIKGVIQAAPNGGWEGQATFKLAFRKGGAIEFAQLMMKAASAGYPFVVYGPPQAGYGPPQAGYGPSQVGYGPSPGVYGMPQDTDPYQLEMKLYRLQMKPHQLQMKPCLRDMKFYLLEIELGLAK